MGRNAYKKVAILKRCVAVIYFYLKINTKYKGLIVGDKTNISRDEQIFSMN